MGYWHERDQIDDLVKALLLVRVAESDDAMFGLLPEGWRGMCEELMVMKNVGPFVALEILLRTALAVG